jgi:glycosyltransferase involved in cell wall biosynthesis
MKKMKIAICTTNYSVYSETFIKAQVDLLPASLVLHSGWLPTQFNNGVPIQNRFQFSLRMFFQEVLKINLFNLETSIGRLLKKNKIDLVLAQYGPGGAAMLSVCKKYRIPLVVHFHGFDASDKSIIEQNAASYCEMFDYAKAIIAVSSTMKKKLIDLGCPQEKIHHITYGPNDIFFKNNPSYLSNTFLGIGRFVNKKAPYLTILAFKELSDEYPDARLKIAGEGELLNTCRNITKAFKIEDKVTFLGAINPEQIRIEMENALAFVQHSVVADSGDSEGTPVAVLEAQAAALPVIATNHAGIPDVVVEDKTGFLVPETDIYAMKEAMKKILNNRSLAKEMGSAGRHRIKNNFTMEMYIDKLKKALYVNE